MKSHPVVPMAIGVALTLSCGGHKGVREDDPYTPSRITSLQKDLKYHKVIVRPFTVGTVEETDNPQNAAVDCQTSAVGYLTQKGLFSSVQISPDAIPDADTVVVDASVTALRIVSGGARFWAGALAGSSKMALVVNAKDARGSQVGQRAVSNDTNAFGGAWTMGATDRGLPGDMGYLVADSIIQLAVGQSAVPAVAK